MIIGHKPYNKTMTEKIIKKLNDMGYTLTQEYRNYYEYITENIQNENGINKEVRVRVEYKEISDIALIDQYVVLVEDKEYNKYKVFLDLYTVDEYEIVYSIYVGKSHLNKIIELEFKDQIQLYI